MRKRIYWVLPNYESSLRTMNDLLFAGIEERQIHFSTREGGQMDGLRAASFMQASDLISAAQTGSVLGSMSGAVLGVLAAFVLTEFIGAPAMVVVILTALGSLLGAWIASLVSSDMSGRRIKRFRAAVDDGAYLLMVDAPQEKVLEIEALLAHTHPEAHFEGERPHIPALM